jgi:hypothetical protein
MGLLDAASDDWAKALRLLLLACVPLVIIGLAVGAGAAVVLLAVRGASPFKASTLISAIVVGCGVLTGTTGGLVSLIRRRASAASDDRSPDRR